MSATFTGAMCRPMEKGQVAKAIMLRCPVCLSNPVDPGPLLLIDTASRHWRAQTPPYVAIGAEQDAACQALMDHLDKAHDATDYNTQAFDATFTAAGIVTPRQWEKLLRRVKS